MERDTREASESEVTSDGIIRINEGELSNHIDLKVKQTVEEMLNGLLNTEADKEI